MQGVTVVTATHILPTRKGMIIKTHAGFYKLKCLDKFEHDLD